MPVRPSGAAPTGLLKRDHVTKRQSGWIMAGVYQRGQHPLRAARMLQAVLPEHPEGCEGLRCHCWMAPWRRWIPSPQDMVPCAQAGSAGYAAQRTALLPLSLQERV